VREWQVLYTERSVIERRGIKSNFTQGTGEFLSIITGSVMILGLRGGMNNEEVI
jgi:hypothetical protein